MCLIAGACTQATTSDSARDGASNDTTTPSSPTTDYSSTSIPESTSTTEAPKETTTTTEPGLHVYDPLCVVEVAPGDSLGAVVTARLLDELVTVASIHRPFEIIVVDDGSTDGSTALLRERETAGELKLTKGPGRGTAAAINAGIREASHPIVCQVDQDVIVHAGWLTALLGSLADPEAAAAQGHYVVEAWSRILGASDGPRPRTALFPYGTRQCPSRPAPATRRTCASALAGADPPSTKASDTDTTTT